MGLDEQALLVQAVGLSRVLCGNLLPYLPDLPQAGQRRIRRLLDALEKVIADEIQIDGSGYPSERTTKGSYRIVSATDLDATFRQHDDDLTLGSNVGIATTATRIRAVVVQTGATPDGTFPEALLRQRWQVEPTIAWLTRSQGCRTARCSGQAAAQFQVWQACAMRNLLQWLSRRRRGAAEAAA